MSPPARQLRKARRSESVCAGKALEPDQICSRSKVQLGIVECSVLAGADQDEQGGQSGPPTGRGSTVWSNLGSDP
jgi:hypothetical protein